MVTIPRPAGASATYADLVPISESYEGGDFWSMDPIVGGGAVSFEWDVPYTIRYGGPFAVSVTGSLGGSAELPAGFDDAPCCVFFDFAADRDFYAQYEAVPIPVSIPEPSTGVLFVVAAITGAGVWVRREWLARH